LKRPKIKRSAAKLNSTVALTIKIMVRSEKKDINKIYCTAGFAKWRATLSLNATRKSIKITNKRHASRQRMKKRKKLTRSPHVRERKRQAILTSWSTQAALTIRSSQVIVK
jgi:hypothetical protein